MSGHKPWSQIKHKKKMNRRVALKEVGEGWSVLVNKYFDFVDVINSSEYDENEPDVAAVVLVENSRGMLRIVAEADEFDVVQEMLDKLAWAIERDSAKMCEVCGEKGYRRKSLPGTPNRCKQHYIELTNEMAESGEIDV